MTSEKLLELLGGMDDCYIEEATPVPKKSKKNWIAVAAVAAIIALAVAIPFAARLLPSGPANAPGAESLPPADTSVRIGVGKPTEATETVDSTEATEPVRAYSPLRGAFGDELRQVALTDAQLARLREAENLASLADYPTLTDPYPADQGGLMVAITQEMRERELAAGRDFLSYYFGTPASDLTFATEESVSDHILFFENEELSGGVNLTHIHVTMAAPYEGEMTAEAIAKQPIVKAALAWKGLSLPETREEVGLNAEGEAYRYRFTFAAHGGDPVEQLLSFSFRAVTVTVYPAQGLFSVEIDYDDPFPPEAAETAPVTREQIDAYLAKAWPDAPQTEYVTEFFYSSRVKFGKLVPCCRIYLPEPDCPRVAGRVVCSVVEASATEIAAFGGTIDAELAFLTEQLGVGRCSYAGEESPRPDAAAHCRRYIDVETHTSYYFSVESGRLDSIVCFTAADAQASDSPLSDAERDAAVLDFAHRCLATDLVGALRITAVHYNDANTYDYALTEYLDGADTGTAVTLRVTDQAKVLSAVFTRGGEEN